jgi:hypothetical protein
MVSMVAVPNSIVFRRREAAPASKIRCLTFRRQRLEHFSCGAR